MVAFADTSFLVLLYLSQPGSKQAKALMNSQARPLAYTPLHRLELRNAMRLCVHRGEIERTRRHAALIEIEHDLADGILVHIRIEWTDLLREAEQLSAQFTEEIGSRSLDLLLVALATLNRAREFISCDHRQRTLASRAGLRVLPAEL